MPSLPSLSPPCPSQSPPSRFVVLVMLSSYHTEKSARSVEMIRYDGPPHIFINGISLYVPYAWAVCSVNKLLIETFSTEFSEKTANHEPRFARKLISARRSWFSDKRNGLWVFRTTFPRNIKLCWWEKWLLLQARRDFNDLLTVISHEDSSDSSEDSSDEDDLDTLFLFSMFPDNKSDFTRKNFEDLTNFECEEMFRQVLCTFYWVSHVFF